MMQRVLNFFSSRISGLHQAAYILGGFTLLSSLIAFVRDRLLAHTFGAGAELDLYYAAFRIPDLIFVGVASLVSAYVLIPALASRREEDQRLYIDSIVAAFSVLIVFVATVAYIFTPQILRVAFPVFFEGGHFAELVLLTRIMLLQPIFLGFSNIAAAIVQVQGRYVLYATAPVLYSIGIIIGIVFLYPVLGLTGLSWGVVLGSMMHIGILLPAVRKEGFMKSVPRAIDIRVCIETMKFSLPRALTLSMNQVAIFVLIAIAGSLSAGSIAIFTFAFNLQSVPLAIIGASYSVAAFPVLARMLSVGARAEFIVQVTTAARHIMFWAFPAIAFAVVLRAHMVRVILGTGKFDWTDTRLTAAAFALFIISLVAHALLLLLVRAYYAAGKTLIPFIVHTAIAGGAISLGYGFLNLYENLGFREALESALRVQGVLGTEVLVLPLAYTISSIVGLLILVVLFEISFGGFTKGIARTFWQGVISAGVGGAVSYVVLTTLGGITSATTLSIVFLHGLGAGLAGIVASVIVLWILKSRELREIVRTTRERYSWPTILSGEPES